MANQAVHKRITNIEELIGRSHAILEDRLNRLESLLLSDPARASVAETTLMWQLLYGAVARYGLSMGGGAEVAAIQLPLLTVPPSHRLEHQKDEATGLVRISIVSQGIPAQDLTLPVAGEEQLAHEEAAQGLVPSTAPDVPATPSPSPGGGFVIEPDDAPFVTEQELAEQALEADMTRGVREE